MDRIGEVRAKINVAKEAMIENIDSILERGDVEEGLDAAAAIGDDRIQRMSGSRINPEAFTHGSSEQRVAWFRRGLQSGDPQLCDTFGTDD